MEEIVVRERSRGVCIRQLALGCNTHVEKRIVEIKRRVIERDLEHARGVQCPDCERDRWSAGFGDGRAVPVVPLESSGAGGGGPKIRCDVDFKVAGCDVVEGGDDDRLVDVFGCVVKDFPSAWVMLVSQVDFPSMKKFGGRR